MLRFWLLAAALQVAVLAVISTRLYDQNVILPARAAGCGLLTIPEYVLTSRKVVLQDLSVGPAAVHVKDGKIAGVAPIQSEASIANLTVAAGLKYGLKTILNYEDLIISPGFIDVHVHLNEPGRTQWEGFVTGTKAAAAGGTTSIVEMPLNAHPAVTTVELLLNKIAASKDKLWSDVGFWGGIVPWNAGNHSLLQGMLDAGALGFKSFMSPSGMDDFPNVARAHIEAALPFLKAQGKPYYVHAESPDEVKYEGDARSHADYVKSRPPAWEVNALRTLLEVLESSPGVAQPGFNLHIAHLSDTSSLPVLAEAKKKGLPLTVETCPHYLNFVTEDVADGDTRFKCAPPIRGRKNQESLWEGLTSGVIDNLASDHSPSPPELKVLDTGDFTRAWGGISGLQYNLPATWDAMKKRGLGPELLARWWSQAPAKLAGLQERKGAIAVGLDADFVVWDPDRLANTSEAALQHRHKLTPFTDMELAGRVWATFVRGQLVFSEGTDFAPSACGALLLNGKL